MLVTLVGFFDAVYGTRCMQLNCGCFGQACGRALFYFAFGVYALPVAGTLDMTRHGTTDADDKRSEDVLAFVGVGFAFFASLTHCVYYMCFQFAARGSSEAKELSSGAEHMASPGTPLGSPETALAIGR